MDIADALIQALVDRGVKTVYGVPGDFVLGLFARFEGSGIDVVCAAGEEGAAFAADAEARLRGLGVVMITYGVGALKIVNAIAGAHAERSPVLVISGSPGVKERGGEPLIHHSVYKHSDSPQRRIFQEICVENASLDSANTAVQEMKKVLDGIKAFSRPGYLEIPRDRITRKLPFPMPSLTDLPQNLRMSAIQHLEVSSLQREQGMKVLEWMRSKERPIVLAGVLLQRFNLQGLLMNVLVQEGWMCATSLTAKTLIPESHPLSLGIYHGAMTCDSVRKEVENSDGVLMIGFPLEDIDTGMFTMDVSPDRLIRVDVESGLHWTHSDDEASDELLLPSTLLKVWSLADPPTSKPMQRPSYSPRRPVNPFVPATASETQPTVRRLIEAVGNIIDERTILLAEVGDALFASSDLHLPLDNTFLTSGFWCTLGFVLPGAIGAWYADKETRPIVLIGDGSFLMSAIEMATLARYKVPAMIIVLDNAGYGTERPMLDGAFNDIQPVDHSQLAMAYGFEKARRANTETELWDALQELYKIDNGPTLISVSLDKLDSSDALKNLTANLKKRM